MPVYQFSLSEKDHQLLKAIAKKESRTMSGEVSFLVRQRAEQLDVTLKPSVEGGAAPDANPKS